MRTLKFEKQAWLWLALALILSIALKGWLIIGDYVPFNSDEAIVALMARHILNGDRPVFFYGQAYMGSLDAFLVAGAFSLFGEQVWGIRLVQACLYLGVLVTTAWLGFVAFKSWRVGALGALLLALPTVNLTLYTTVSLGGYGEALLIGNLILIYGLKIVHSIGGPDFPRLDWNWLLLGFLCGLGLWAFGLTLVYTIPVVFCLLFCLYRWFKSPSRLRVLDSGNGLIRERIRGPAGLWFLFVFGALAGSFPWWGYALQLGFGQLIYELQGGAISGVEGLPWYFQIAQHIFSMILLGGTVLIGMRPPWDVTWLALPLLPFVLIFWIGVGVYALRLLRKESPHRRAVWLLIGVIIAVMLAFVLTPFGADPSGRYFLPMMVPMTLLGAILILDFRERIGFWAYGLAGLVLLFQFWGNMQSALQNPQGITTQFYSPAQVDHRSIRELGDFLQQKGETYGYTNYWVSYPLAFLSQETLIYVPRLPYHPDYRYTERDDRYAPYGDMVAQAERVAYITTNHPALNDYLREHFSSLGVTWEETKIGDYMVFYGISRVVRPGEIGLGRSTP